MTITTADRHPLVDASDIDEVALVDAVSWGQRRVELLQAVPPIGVCQRGQNRKNHDASDRRALGRSPDRAFHRGMTEICGRGPDAVPFEQEVNR